MNTNSRYFLLRINICFQVTTPHVTLKCCMTNSSYLLQTIWKLVLSIDLTTVKYF